MVQLNQKKNFQLYHVHVKYRVPVVWRGIGQQTFQVRRWRQQWQHVKVEWKRKSKTNRMRACRVKFGTFRSFTPGCLRNQLGLWGEKRRWKRQWHKDTIQPFNSLQFFFPSFFLGRQKPSPCLLPHLYFSLNTVDAFTFNISSLFQNLSQQIIESKSKIINIHYHFQFLDWKTVLVEETNKQEDLSATNKEIYSNWNNHSSYRCSCGDWVCSRQYLKNYWCQVFGNETNKTCSAESHTCWF